MPPRGELTALHLRVLAFLLMHPQAQGSDIAAELKTKSGTLYPLLHQLAERGLLLAEVQEFGSGRTTYSVTSAGQNCFADAALKLISDLTPALERVTAPAHAQANQPSQPRKTRFNQEIDDLTAKIHAGAVLKSSGWEYALESPDAEPQRVAPRAASELIRRAIVTESAPGEWVSASPNLFS